MTARVDLTNRAFGGWHVLSYVGNMRWLCRCECGVEKAVDGYSLRSGRSADGETRTRLYTIWNGIIGRCENKNDHAYPRYGGRGISICRSWRISFETFRDWAMTHGYNPALTIDRKENDKGYEPSNCRWATYTEQNRNRRDNNPITYNGERILIPVLAERHGLPADIVKNRIRRYGWTIDRAISTPVGLRGHTR